ncbi:DUF4179 domain-containing protein [Neobacillus sp. D3-1R]|uniref:DUF4179 domain-containing protein n=1 Tax=Neobacillus sp. D3-1R TaxID=3445778 RepID=UPI003F9FC171
MKCPTTDKLSQFVDELLVGQELIDIKSHTETCKECQLIIEAFRHEQQFLKETLQTPTLPDDFASLVLEQVEPYKQKSIRLKKAPWKKMLFSAAGVVLAIGVSTSLNPAFAKWIDGLFSSSQVDEGLRVANEAGFVKRLNQEVTDKGLTFKIEDVMADSSRIALSYQILSETGKVKNPYFELGHPQNSITVFDDGGKKLELNNMSWGNQHEYGLIEFSLRDIPTPEQLMVKIQLGELDGRDGNWQLDVPINLKESLQATTTVPLKGKQISFQGVSVNMKEIRFAPSTTEIIYETALTDEAKAELIPKISQLEEQYGKNSLANFGTDIQYHIENEEGKAILHHNTFFNGKGHPSDSGTLQGSGEDIPEDIGHVLWNQSFIPKKDKEKLSFVLDGIFKTEPSDFFIKIKPKELKKHPISFEYEGNFVTIKKAEKDSEFSLRKSLIPIEKKTIFKIEMEGGKEALSSALGVWTLVDQTGKTYETFHSGSILDEKDENGRFKTTTELMTYGLDEVPDELTLKLLSVTRYHELKDKWKVPLY